MSNHFGGPGLPELVIVLTVAIVGGVLIVWPASRILRRLGFPVWLAPLALIPLVNIGLLNFVAFAPTPETASERERS